MKKLRKQKNIKDQISYHPSHKVLKKRIKPIIESEIWLSICHFSESICDTISYYIWDQVHIEDEDNKFII